MTASDRVKAAYHRATAQGHGKNMALLEAARAEKDNVTVGCFGVAAVELGFTTGQATLLWQQVQRERPRE